MSREQITQGALLTYACILLNNLVSLLFTPFILRCLGQSEYGLYALIGAFVSYLALFDLGLNVTISRYVAKFRAEDNAAAEANFLALSLLIYCVLSLCSLSIGACLYPFLPRIFKHSLDARQLATAQTMYIILIGNVALTLPLNSFPAIMTGREEFTLPKHISIARTLARVACLYVVLTAGYKALAIIIIDTILNILSLLIIAWYVLLKLKVKIHFQPIHRQMFTEISLYSFFIFLIVLEDQIFWRLGQVLLGVVADASAVAVFAIGIQFVSYYMQCSTAISNLFLPRATQMVVACASGEALTDLLVRTGRVQLMIVGFLLGAFALLGKRFILLWAGRDYIMAWPVAMVVMLAFTIPLCQNVGLCILQAKRLHPFRSYTLLIAALLNIAISSVLSRTMGVMGVAIGTAIALIVGDTVVMNFYYHYRVGLNMPRYFKDVSRRTVPAMLVAYGLSMSILLLPAQSWRTFILNASLFSCIYVGVLWIMGMNLSERQLLHKALWNVVSCLHFRSNGYLS